MFYKTLNISVVSIFQVIAPCQAPANECSCPEKSQNIFYFLTKTKKHLRRKKMDFPAPVKDEDGDGGSHDQQAAHQDCSEYLEIPLGIIPE